MQVLLWVGAVLMFLVSLLMWGGAKSAIHEILAGVTLLIATVCVVGASLLGELVRVRKAVAGNGPFTAPNRDYPPQ